MKNHLNYWKEKIESVVLEYEIKDNDMESVYTLKSENLKDNMFCYIDRLKRPDSELLDLTFQSKNAVE